MLKFRMLAAFALSAVMVAGVFADDEPEKKKKKAGARGQNRSAATQLLKRLDEGGVSLSDEQKAKVAALAKTLKADLTAANSAAGITPEILKKRAEAGKEAREAGKKGEELQAAMDAASTLTDEQKAALKAVGAKQQKFRKDIFGLLTNDQKENLSPQLKKQLQGRGDGDGQPKKKKNKDAA